jgi:hypothetical protein
MSITDTLAVTVNSKALTLVEKACQAMAALDVASSRTSFPYPEAPLIKDIMRQMCETLVETNEALAACQEQSAGRIRELEGLARDGKIYRWLQGNPDDCASAVADAYSQWHPGDPDPKPFDAILEGEVERLMRKRGAWGSVVCQERPARSDADVFAEALGKIAGGSFPRNRIETHFFNDPDHTEYCIECGQPIDTQPHRDAVEKYLEDGG